jgi:hypothetical protein
MFGASPVELMAANAMMAGLVYCESFTYSSQWLTGTASALGASASVDQQIQVNSDSDFVMQEINLDAWTALDTIIVNPDYLLNIVMAGSGRQIFDRPQGVVSFTGSFQQNKVPGKMPFPRIITANSTITNSLQNRTVTAANRVELVFRGFKVFYLKASRQDVFHVL